MRAVTGDIATPIGAKDGEVRVKVLAVNFTTCQAKTICEESDIHER